MAAAHEGEDVYASLLLTDTYLPGALVLAHSLRDAGTKKKLAILVTLDTVSAEVITQLKAVYDYVIPVPRIRNERPANLFLMNRPDLHSAFTKINLWKQTQFRKIVYLDADVVAYRAPDELFDLPHAFSAAPDIGWPDLFNTGVMALTPNMGDYYALMAMAQRGISFDGADQGLLNMHFKNTYNRLSFTYNVTPSAHYQYVPAYKHFQSSINLVHFIGSEKPWLQGRDKSIGDSPFDEIAGRWWAVYDRHYRIQSPTIQTKQATPATPASAPVASAAAPEIVRYFVKGEYQPTTSYLVPVAAPGTSHGQQSQPPSASSFIESSAQLEFHPALPESQHHHHGFQTPAVDFQPHQPSDHQHQSQDPQVQPYEHHPESHHGHHHVFQHQHHQGPQSQNTGQQPQHPASFPSVSFQPKEGTQTEARTEQVPEQQHHHQQQQPGGQSSGPEPEYKPEPYQPPPVQSWDAQRQPPPSDSKPEALNFPQTHYEMSSDPTPFVPPERYPSPPKDMWYEVPKQPPAPAHEKPKPIFPWEDHQPRPSRVFHHQDASGSPKAETPAASFGEREASMESQPQAEPSLTGSPTVEPKSEPQTPPTPTVRNVPSNPWSSFPRSNAWDEVPEINRYVDSIQAHRRTRSHGLGKTPPQLILRERETSWGRGGFRVTDFPSEDDRPSLPVTPAPIRRPKFWGGGAPGIGLEDEEDDERLPTAEGVPGQSDWDPVSQLQKLAQQQSDALLRRLSASGAVGEEVIGTEGREIPSRPLPYGSEELKSPTYVAFSPPEVVSPKPVKPSHGTSPVQNILNARLDEGPSRTATQSMMTIVAPSYQGPGVTFEKGESVPISETPLLPSEEQRDILET